LNSAVTPPADSVCFSSGLGLSPHIVLRDLDLPLEVEDVQKGGKIFPKA
jgi:hypothetical protein